MAQQKYYPEEILVEKMQSGEYGWLDYINHFSAEWQEEYAHYCEEKGLSVCEDSAASNCSSLKRTNPAAESSQTESPVSSQ